MWGASRFEGAGRSSSAAASSALQFEEEEEGMRRDWAVCHDDSSSIIDIIAASSQQLMSRIALSLCYPDTAAITKPFSSIRPRNPQSMEVASVLR